MLKVKFNPPGHSCEIEIMATKEQERALNLVKENHSEFDAYFWAEKVSWLNKEDKTYDGCQAIRIDGVHYVIGDEDATSFWKGNGGHKFTIKLLSGEEITTTNLWHQGAIPEELKHILIDNAEWVN